VEKNAQAGGRCDRFSLEGHHFDTGPTLFVFPQLYEAEFRSLGTTLNEQLELQRVEPTYQLVFDNGSRLVLSSDMDWMRQQLEGIEPGSFQGLQRYLQEGEQHYRLVLENILNRDFRRAADFFRVQHVPLAIQLRPLLHHYRHMSDFFEEPRLKSAFTFQDMYTGLSPFEAPATYSMMPYTELAHGVWYPKGGMYRIVERLMDLAIRAGVEFSFNSPVERIETDSCQALGVRLAGGPSLKADGILANADLPYVYETLLPPSRMAKTLMSKHYSCSAISFFWGVDKQYPELGPHTLFLSDDFQATFRSIGQGLSLPANATVYIHAPARLDASMAPPGQDTLIAIVPVGHLSDAGGQNWGRLRGLARQQVFRRLQALGIIDLEAHLKFERAYTPVTWANRYNLMKGSTHGLSHRLTQMAWFRPHNRHAQYRNLYFVGASTHPGTGIPTAMVSGRLAARRIQDEMI
jgi:phytoene desaturase